MHRLDDEGAVQRVRQGTARGEAPRRLGIRCEAGVPDDIEVVTWHWNPLDSKIGVGTTFFVLVLRESEEVRAGVE